MPTLEVSKKDLFTLIGKSFSDAKLAAILPLAKGSVENIAGDTLTVEIADVNRPDLWSTEGIARELRARLGLAAGLKQYKVKKSAYSVKVERKVKSVRPLIACAVVKGLKLSSEAIAQLIQLQEKLCENFGRRRAEAALGIYDFDKINWPVRYTTTKPTAIRFVPLDFKEALTPKEILQKHEKGREYAHLIEKAKEYPILIDTANNILSMPPIINSDYSGKVTEKTKNVFVEVTGSSYRFILPVLSIMICALAERGGELNQVSIVDKKRLATPSLKPGQASVKQQEINSILGLQLSSKQITQLLQKSGFDVKTRGNSFTISYPAYRQDILDSRDIIEDVGISYGYDKLQPLPPRIATIGKASSKSEIIKKVATLLNGLGYQEIATFTLTAKEKQSKAMRIKEVELVELANPLSATYSSLRSWLLPSTLEFLSKNKDVNYPQQVFELGDCIEIKDNKAAEKLKLSIALAHAKVGFTQAKQVLDYLTSSLGIKCSVTALEHPSFIDGRTASVSANVKGKAKTIGFIGEVHPAVLSNWKISMPVAAIELDLTDLL